MQSHQIESHQSCSATQIFLGKDLFFLMMTASVQSITTCKDKILFANMVWQGHVCIYVTETHLSFLANKELL